MKDDKKAELGLKMISKWFSRVPKWLRYVIVMGTLIFLVYVVNKGIGF